MLENVAFLYETSKLEKLLNASPYNTSIRRDAPLCPHVSQPSLTVPNELDSTIVSNTDRANTTLEELADTLKDINDRL